MPLLSLEMIAKVTASSFTEKFATPRQGALNQYSTATIELEKIYSGDYLEGLDGFSHCWLIWFFHLNEGKSQRAKVQAPRNKGQKMGVFATRSPHRPNPLGLSLVKIDRLKNSCLEVSGVDFVVGTPIFDIKPFIAEDQPKNPFFGWTSQIIDAEVQVHWQMSIETALPHFSRKESAILRQTIEASLKLDPRPLIYKKLEITQGYEGPYGARINGFNIRFLARDNKFTIIEILDET